jgi:hypothetical protein
VVPNVACTRAGVAALAAILFLAAGNGDQTTGADLMQAATTPDFRREMITALPATGPRPSLGDEARVFDRFVGTWDTEYIAYADDGSVSRMPGEVRFGWVLDGWALQDIWITYPDGASKERNIGTTLRFYDEEAGTWRIIWVYPARRTITLLTGGLVGDRIVLEGQDKDGTCLRWSFNDIRRDSLVWRGEISRDDGRTWRLAQEHRFSRRTHPSSAS